MGFDTGTLIRAAGSGLVGHKQGQIAARDRADFEAREAEDAQTRDIQRQVALFELHARENPPVSTPTYGVDANGNVTGSGFGAEEDAREFQERNPAAPQEPKAPTYGARSDGAVTMTGATDQAQLKAFFGNNPTQAEPPDLSDLGSALDNAWQVISQAQQQAQEFGENEEDAANKAAQDAGFEGLAHFVRVRQKYLQAILKEHGLGGDGPSGGGTGGGGPEKEVITRDHAEYLRTTQGWPDEQIAEVYTVR